MAKTPEELYQEREKRFNETIQLKVPDRIPIAPHFHFFEAKYSGLNCQEAMYDYDRLAEATRKAIVDFDLDMCMNPLPLVSVGPAMEILGYRQFKWPGHGVSVDSTYQYVEKEYMTADEYDAFLNDPTDYILRTYIPRVLGALEPLKMLPYIPGVTHFLGPVIFLPAAFATPPIAQALETLVRAGQESLKMISRTMAFDKEMADLGFPSVYGSFAWAPYDCIGDHFRGTTGIMLDMYERPDKLLAAINKVTPAIINTAVMLVQQTNIPRAFIPLHKGLDGFMSPQQFDTFYWPSLKQVILALIEQNIVPIVLWEGDCTSRLETIADIPKGKAIYHFERTDMHRAKEVLGGQVCIMGLMPSWVLCTGSQQDVRDYCKRLIDVVGKGGGYILNGDVGIPDEAKPENVKAMVDFTKEYGVYK